jgi:PAS domain S-box-containing protein
MSIAMGSSFVIEVANQRMLELWGKSADEIIGKPVFDVMPEARVQGLEQVVQHVYLTGERFVANEYPVMLVKKGREEKLFLNFVYEPFRGSDGAIAGVMVVAVDVTDLVTARTKVEESHKEFQFVTDFMPQMIWVTRPDGYHYYYNKQWYDYTGLTYGETEGEGWNHAFHPDDQERAWKVWRHSLATGEPYEIEYRCRRYDGAYRWFLGRALPLKDEEGKIIKWFGTCTEIHDQKLAEEALKKSEARSRAAIEIARLGTFEIDVQQQTIIHSPRNAEILGLDPTKQWPYQSIIETVHPEDRAVRSKALEEAKQTGVLFYEARIIHADQSIRWVRLNGRYVQHDNQPRIIGTLMDITAEKKAAEVLEQKVEERTRELKQVNDQLKQFTYAASHDLQEPLRKISFFLDRLLANFGPTLNEENKQITERLQHTAHRMRSLIDDLLAYSNTSLGVTGFEEIRLTGIIEEVLDDMEATILEKGAEVNVLELPIVKGDRRQLRQLFQNLISNALKYHKKGELPKVKITAQKVLGKEIEAKLSFSTSNNDFHLIEIKDNGIGFDPDDADRIFNLFQRLHGKAEYEGTGVGLAIVQKVVENHNGYIWAESEPGKGAKFKVLLPIK